MFRIGGKQRSRVKAVLCECDIYKPQEIDICGKFRKKEAKLVKNCRRARAHKPDNQFSLALYHLCIIRF